MTLDAPGYLTDEGRELFDLVVAELQRIGRLDAPTVRRAGRYCQLLTQWLRVTRFINDNGQVVEIRDDKGEVKNSIVAPEVKIQSDLEKHLRTFEKDFGYFDPLKTPGKAGQPKAQAEGDPLATLRNRLAQLASGQPSRN